MEQCVIREVLRVLAEDLFAWLHNSRRLVTRYERYLANYPGFVHLACILILLPVPQRQTASAWQNAAWHGVN